MKMFFGGKHTSTILEDCHSSNICQSLNENITKIYVDWGNFFFGKVWHLF